MRLSSSQFEHIFIIIFENTRAWIQGYCIFITVHPPTGNGYENWSLHSVSDKIIIILFYWILVICHDHCNKNMLRIFQAHFCERFKNTKKTCNKFPVVQLNPISPGDMGRWNDHRKLPSRWQVALSLACITPSEQTHPNPTRLKKLKSPPRNLPVFFPTR